VSETVILQAGGTSDEDTDVRHATSYWRYLGRKCGGALFSLVLVVLLAFFSFRILPGDPVATLTHGRHFTAEQMLELRRTFGLDKSLWDQFLIFINDLFHGNLGTSFTFRSPVSELIGDYLWPTLLLTSVSALLSIVLGLWIGQRAAWKRDSFFDRSSTGLALVFWSMPTFWFGLLLLLAFGGGLQLFPTAGMTTAGTDYTGFAYVWDVARHLVLPVATMVVVTYAQYSLIMRASLLEEMTSDYLVTARAKGLTEDMVRRKHAVPNALLPSVTIIFLQIGTLIAGAVTVETVFSWPGLGYLTFQALQGPDLPLLQGTFVVFSSIVIITNLAADLVYRAIDPRVRAA
jgi:peptide/nickel transport system permease protein